MKNDEWLTPPHVLQALGAFNLDPCAPVNRPWEMTEQHYTAHDNGLQKPWHGRVWLNPPYGLEAAQWLSRLAAHGAGTALIFARTETEMFFENVWSKASALLFLKGRLHFHHVDGTRAAANGGAPSVLIAYGEMDAEILKTCKLPGAFVPLIAHRARDCQRPECMSRGCFGHCMKVKT
ncbi:DNA N-6-adenine-methyltransferase [Comamonas aquatilis]|uniref:DNA N-6-adenine-methyltransferase n=1 Tax=Comamonas aquatilis TaxID=1778406 RepID=UPI0039EFF9FB